MNVDTTVPVMPTLWLTPMSKSVAAFAPSDAGVGISVGVHDVG